MLQWIASQWSNETLYSKKWVHCICNDFELLQTRLTRFSPGKFFFFKKSATWKSFVFSALEQSYPCLPPHPPTPFGGSHIANECYRHSPGVLSSPNLNSSSLPSSSSGYNRSHIHYSGYYNNNLSQVDIIHVAVGKVIKIEFTAFDVESNGPTCPYDHLSILDRDGTVLLDKACGIKQPFTICSQTHEVYFTFITDCSVTRPGWSAVWSEQIECSSSAIPLT